MKLLKSILGYTILFSIAMASFMFLAIAMVHATHAIEVAIEDLSPMAQAAVLAAVVGGGGGALVGALAGAIHGLTSKKEGGQ